MTPGEKRFLTVAALIIIAALCLLPIYWMVVSAFKTEAEITAPSPTFFPRRPTLQNFRAIWRSFGRPCLNSLIVSVSCTVLIVLFSTMAGYVLAKRRFAGRRTFFAIIIGAMLIPPSILIVPLFCIITAIGLHDTLIGLILPFAVTAFGIFLMRQFAAEIPDELIESAQIDGCSEWAIFRHIIVPFMKPAMIVLAIIEFVNNWNSFTVPLVLINSPHKETLQLVLANLRRASDTTPWSQVMAATVLTVLPVVALFLIFQRGIMRSIMRTTLSR